MERECWDAYKLFPQIADDCLTRLNHKGYYNPKTEQAIAVEDKPEVTTVVEIEDDEELSNDIFFLLNNLNIRHNNCAVGDPKYKRYIADMDEDTLEDWYDELYQLILLAKLGQSHSDFRVEAKFPSVQSVK